MIRRAHKQRRPVPPVERIYRILGNRVAERRLELGCTQQWLADRVGWSRASIANIEAGRQRVLLHHIPMLTRALRLPAGALWP